MIFYTIFFSGGFFVQKKIILTKSLLSFQYETQYRSHKGTSRHRDSNLELKCVKVFSNHRTIKSDEMENIICCRDLFVLLDILIKS